MSITIDVYQLQAAYQRYQDEHELPVDEGSPFRNVILQWEARPEADKSVMTFVLSGPTKEPRETLFSMHKVIISPDGLTTIPDFLIGYHRRVMPSLIAGDDLPGVAPMMPPNDEIFKLRKKYTTDNT